MGVPLLVTSFSRACALGLLLCVSLGTAAAEDAEKGWSFSDLLPRSLQRNPRIDLTVITEMTAAGRSVTPPTAEKPATYVLLDGGERTEGAVIAGERPPKPDRLVQVLQASLATNHYRPATHDRTPDLVVYYRWGSFNQIDLSLFDATDGTPANPADTPYSEATLIRHRVLLAGIVGGDKFALEFLRAIKANRLESFRLRDRKTEWLVDETLDTNRYFLIATAYDGPALAAGKRQLLWRTKMSSDSHGLAMHETIPVLVTSARDYFGKETPEPVVLSPRLKEGRVEIGTTTVKEYIDTLPAPAPKPGASPAPAPAEKN